MKYRVILKADGEEYDSRFAETDQELYQALGKFAVYYFPGYDGGSKIFAAIDYG